MRLVIALGGNALLRRDEPPEAATQAACVAAVAPALAQIARDHQVVFVHGNGPQIGLLARESGADPTLKAPYPLAALGAETQGLIGSLLSQALHNAGRTGPIITLVTHTVVDAQDPAMTDPSKPIGPVYGEQRAQQLVAGLGWDIAPDGDGWRRVVPSPMPCRVVELETGASLLESGATVIMAGGGGVPLTDNRTYHQVDAVIDKDHTAALLACELGADQLVILTDVPGVFTDYGTAEQRLISLTTPTKLQGLEFAAGSMGPKVAAACSFVEATGKSAVIGQLEHAIDVVAGKSGTLISDGGCDCSGCTHTVG